MFFRHFEKKLKSYKEKLQSLSAELIRKDKEIVASNRKIKQFEERIKRLNSEKEKIQVMRQNSREFRELGNSQVQNDVVLLVLKQLFLHLFLLQDGVLKILDLLSSFLISGPVGCQIILELMNGVLIFFNPFLFFRVLFLRVRVKLFHVCELIFERSGFLFVVLLDRRKLSLSFDKKLLHHLFFVFQFSDLFHLLQDFFLHELKLF